MPIKVLTWNIRRRAVGWNHILNTLRPDIAFVQESPSPPEFVSAAPFVHEPIEQTGATRPWGNAIYVRNGGLMRIDVDTRHVGSLLVGEVELPSGDKVALINVYGLLARVPL